MIAPAQKALLVLRVLAYDRNLKARAGKEVRIALVYKAGHASSEKERDTLLLALEEVSARAVVAGLPVHLTAVPFEGLPALQARLARLSPAALYVATGLEEATALVEQAAREVSALTFCGTREQVVQGLAVGLVFRGERAGLVIDPRRAAEEGADLDAVLLGVAERIDRGR